MRPRFDPVSFLKRNHIPFVTSGPNVKSGDINISCPFCVTDPSHHMGIRIRDGAWACWRSKRHRGLKPHRLIMALLRCSYADADAMLGGWAAVEPSALERIASGKFFARDVPEDEEKNVLKIPSVFLPITSGNFRHPFVSYLTGPDRKFKDSEIKQLERHYHLHYCYRGHAWRQRVILPIYLSGKLVNWTARSIRSDEGLRYRTLSRKDPDEETGATALLSIKDTIYNFDSLSDGGHVLVICEGPFDAIKLDLIGAPYGLRATCLFSLSATEAQIWQLVSLKRRFQRIIILLDRAALGAALDLEAELRSVGARATSLDFVKKDAGELDTKMALRAINLLLSRNG